MQFCEGLGVKFPGATRPPKIHFLAVFWVAWQTIRLQAATRLKCGGDSRTVLQIGQCADHSAMKNGATCCVKWESPQSDIKTTFTKRL